MKLDDYPDVLTIDDVRKVLHIGRSTAYQILKKGTIPCFRVGKQHRVYREALRRYLENGEPAKQDSR